MNTEKEKTFPDCKRAVWPQTVGLRDAALLPLKIEEGGREPWNVGILLEMDKASKLILLLEPPERNIACPHLYFSPAKPMFPCQNSYLQNC